VVYVYLDKLRRASPHEHELARHPHEQASSITTHP
jgi:hypothetical protein